MVVGLEASLKNEVTTGLGLSSASYFYIDFMILALGELSSPKDRV